MTIFLGIVAYIIVGFIWATLIRLAEIDRDESFPIVCCIFWPVSMPIGIFIAGCVLFVFCVQKISETLKGVGKGKSKDKPKGKSPEPTTILAEMIALDILKMEWQSHPGSYFVGKDYKICGGDYTVIGSLHYLGREYNKFALMHGLTFTDEEQLIIRTATFKALDALKEKRSLDAEAERQAKALDAISKKMGINNET